MAENSVGFSLKLENEMLGESSVAVKGGETRRRVKPEITLKQQAAYDARHHKVQSYLRHIQGKDSLWTSIKNHLSFAVFMSSPSYSPRFLWEVFVSFSGQTFPLPHF